MEITIEQAIKRLQEGLRDEGYYEGWKANIAMTFQDEWRGEEFQQSEQDFEEVHKLSNRAADNFLKRLMRQ